MNLWILIERQANAVDYIPKSGQPIRLPFFPNLALIEQLILILIILILINALLKKQTDKTFEIYKLKVLKFVSAAGLLAIAIHAYRQF